MNLKNKIVSLLLVWVLLLSFSTVFAKNQTTIEISNPRDILNLSEKFKSDTASDNITVILKKDIDLSKTEFEPIPYFNGTFDGNGHKISGYSINKDMSYAGFFRYIGENGVVINTNFEGFVSPGGSREYVGGICGKNMGKIKNCTFTGSVDGRKYTGGVTGFNDKSAEVMSTTFSGSVTGLNYTGGIAGENDGTIEDATNCGSINTVYVSEDLSFDNIGEEILNKNFEKTEVITVSTDTGGIAGISSGSIKNSENYGDVGYERVGYNTGGIVGRQKGYVFSCKNYANILGRRDVGGIVGHAEPYLVLDYSDDFIKTMITSLENIGKILSKRHDTSEISNSMNLAFDRADTITNSARSLVNDAVDYGKKLSESAEEVSIRIDNALKKLEATEDDAKKMTDELQLSLDSLTAFCEQAKTFTKNTRKSISSLSDSVDNFSTAMVYLEQALDQMEQDGASGEEIAKGLSDLRKSVKNGLNSAYDTTRLSQQIYLLLGDFAAVDGAVTAIEKLQGILSGTPLPNTDEILKAIVAVKTALSQISYGLDTLSGAVDLMDITTSIILLNKGVVSLKDAFRDLSEALRLFDKALKNSNMTLELKNAFAHLSLALQSAKVVTDAIYDSLHDLLGNERIEIPTISDSYKERLNGLFDDVSLLNNDLRAVKKVLEDETEQIKNDLSDVGNNITDISRAMKNTYQDAVDFDFEKLLEDDDYSYVKLDGRVELCENLGKVEGEENVGGVAGTMAIEYDIDSEDAKKQGEKTLKFSYKTKALINRCQSSAIVKSTKGNTGGIVGKMMLGSVLNSKGAGVITSENGDFTGGVCGYSNSFIKNSISKACIVGNNYTGGIAGKGDTIQNCAVVSDIKKGNEFVGTISGFAEKDNVKNNMYIESKYGGIDDIDYLGVAEKTDFESLDKFSQKELGEKLDFTITFMADGKEVKKEKLSYKESLSDENIPPVPEKDGYYGEWEEFEKNEVRFDQTVNALYFKDASLIKSKLEKNNKSIAMLVGRFNNDTKIKAEKTTKVPDKLLLRKIYGSYYITVESAPSGKNTIRYLYEKKNSIIYKEENGELKRVSRKNFGSYAEFKTDTDEFTVYEVSRSAQEYILYTVIAMILGFAAYILIKKRPVKSRLKKLIAKI